MLKRLHSKLRRWLPRRFIVSDSSMEPALHSGQGLIAVPATGARVGRIHCVEHPAQPNFWLVKRVSTVDGSSMTVESDNHTVPTIDSNTFGAVAIKGSYRVIVKVPFRLM